jgi:hypothetical protein
MIVLTELQELRLDSILHGLKRTCDLLYDLGLKLCFDLLSSVAISV